MARLRFSFRGACRYACGLAAAWPDSGDPYMQNLAVLLGRIGLAQIFILSGLQKIAGYAATGALLAAHGLPPGLLPLVIFAELGGGLAVLFGFLTRWAALGLCVFTLLAAFFLDRKSVV